MGETAKYMKCLIVCVCVCVRVNCPNGVSLRHCFAFYINLIYIYILLAVQGTRVLATGGASCNKDILQVSSKTTNNGKLLDECMLNITSQRILNKLFVRPSQHCFVFMKLNKVLLNVSHSGGIMSTKKSVCFCQSLW